MACNNAAHRGLNEDSRASNSSCQFARLILSFALALLALIAAPAWSQTPHTYDLYLDTDGDASTGCPVTLTDRFGTDSTTGWEYRVRLNVAADGTVGTPELAPCTAGAFGAGTATGSTPHPLDLGRALRAEDRIEYSLPLTALGNPSTLAVALSSSGDYLTRASSGGRLTAFDSGPVPGPITDPSGTPRAIPTLTLGPLLLLAVALAWVARRRLHHPLTLAALFIGSGLLTAALAWAAVITIDGSIADWSAISPLATDPADDNTPAPPTFSPSTSSKTAPILPYASMPPPAATAPPSSTPPPTAPPPPPVPPGTPASAPTTPTATPSPGPSSAPPAGMSITGTATDATGNVTGTIPAWTPPAAGTHTFTARVADPAGATATRSLTLTLTVAPDPGPGPGPPRPPSPAPPPPAPPQASPGATPPRSPPRVVA